MNSPAQNDLAGRKEGNAPYRAKITQVPPSLSVRGVESTREGQRTPGEPEPLLLDLKAAARLLGTSYWHIRGLVKRGELRHVPADRGGRRTLVSRKEVLRWAEQALERASV